MLAFLFIVFLVLEAYVFFGLRTSYSGTSGNWVLAISIVMFLVIIAAFISMGIFYKKGLSVTIWWINILLGLAVTFTVTKLVFALFLLGEDVYRLFDWIIQFFRKDSADVLMDSRRSFITNTGLVVASIPFASFIYGVFKGRYNFTVFKEELVFSDLPDAFNGFKIVQFSDLHAGSFDSFEAMKKGVDLIQAQQPDLILFTGDLVNNLSEEFDPYIELFKGLKAKYGKYSILGNHDYGLYIPWETKEAEKANNQRIRNHHKSIGFHLFENSNQLIEKDGASIRLAGVENWGRPPFPPHGDLNKALNGVGDDEFTILLSHDPHHWEDHVLPSKKHIHLTLSGHTHGMQMGIDLPGFKWSPVSLRYKNWAGLYTEQSQNLYVNRGFGHLGFPGRVGIMPEVTVLELKKSKKPIM